MDPTLSSNGVVLGMFVTFWARLSVVRALLTTVCVVKMNSRNEKRKGAENSWHLHLFHLTSLALHLYGFSHCAHAQHTRHTQSGLSRPIVLFRTTCVKVIRGTQKHTSPLSDSNKPAPQLHCWIRYRWSKNPYGGKETTMHKIEVCGQLPAPTSLPPIKVSSIHWIWSWVGCRPDSNSCLPAPAWPSHKTGCVLRRDYRYSIRNLTPSWNSCRQKPIVRQWHKLQPTY
jgi:hypothetical protein